MKIALKLLNEDTGGVSSPSKMPWYSYSLPASECQVGGRLRGVEGSVCYNCYAFKGNYMWPNVQDAMRRRLERLIADPVKWTESMIETFKLLAKDFMPSKDNKWPASRLHDSGDLQGVWHLEAICKLAKGTQRVELADGSKSAIRWWLPTREYDMVARHRKEYGAPPWNLNIRLSSHMVNGALPTKLAEWVGATVSGVIEGHSPYGNKVKICPAPKQDGQCGACRNCWDKKVPAVVYIKH